METGPGFDLEVSQTPYLSTSAREMHAVLTVTGRDPGTAAGDSAEVAEVVLVDCSGSMSMPPKKIVEARRATAAAVDAIRDGAFFAIVEGTGVARMVYPSTPHMARADARTRKEARAAASRLVASGGTAMGTWLAMARRLLAEHPTAVRHALLLTDGQNGEPPHQLDRVLDECAGSFSCDARGIGADWEPKELRRIVTVLRGQAEAIRTESELADDFRRLTETVMSKTVPDLLIRIRTMPGTSLRFLKQAYPTELDLTEHGRVLDERTVEISTGAWGDTDTREYHLCLSVSPDWHPMDEDIQAARVELAVVRAGTREARPAGGPKPVVVHWTQDPLLPSWIDSKVAHYTGQAELNAAVLAGCDAYDGGRHEEAGQQWGHAVRLAVASGNAEVLTRLERLVDVLDAAQGLVRIREHLRREDFLSAEIGSNITARSTEQAAVEKGGHGGPVGPDRECEACGRISPGEARFCVCGRRFPDLPEPLGEGQPR